MAILITEDRELQTMMIERYPGFLKAEQCAKIPLGYRRNAYTFIGLEHEAISDFLKKYKPSGHTILCHIDS
tara:strand:- start:521 stop:733 length:213 start_codon:yes stop_codon:yes gene_type:complete